MAKVSKKKEVKNSYPIKVGLSEKTAKLIERIMKLEDSKQTFQNYVREHIDEFFIRKEIELNHSMGNRLSYQPSKNLPVPVNAKNEVVKKKDKNRLNIKVTWDKSDEGTIKKASSSTKCLLCSTRIKPGNSMVIKSFVIEGEEVQAYFHARHVKKMGGINAVCEFIKEGLLTRKFVLETSSNTGNLYITKASKKKELLKKLGKK